MHSTPTFQGGQCNQPAGATSLLTRQASRQGEQIRLAEPLRLLAEVGARDPGTLGAFYARVPDALSLRLVVRPLPDGEDARHDHGRRRE